MLEKLGIDYVSPADLAVADYNPRVITEEALSRLRRGIREYGMVAPIIVRAEDSLVIGGHQRLEAAKQEGLETVPVVKIEGLDEREVGALNILLNNPSAQGTWDFSKLADIVSDLDGNGFDATLTGFDESELEQLLAWTPDEPEAEGEVDLTPPENPVSVRGEVYELGEHRLMCGDAVSNDDVVKLMCGALADMVYTDPPYGVNYDGGSKPQEQLVGDDTTELYSMALPLMSAYSESSAALYLWHAGTKSAAVLTALREAGYEIRAQIVWNKNNAQFGAFSAQYHTKHEPLWYAHKKGNSPKWFGPKNEVTVWDCDRANVNEYHPTQKPVELAFRAINNSCGGNGIVLDVFGGSGATLIAAEQCGRKCCMMEIDPAYCDVIRRRYAEFVGDEELLP